MAAELLKAEPPDQSERRLVLRADRGDEALDPVLARSPVEQGSHDLRRVTTSPVRLEDHVANLDRVCILDGVRAGRAMETGVSDHWTVAVRQHDRVDEPFLDLGALAHLPQSQRDEAAVMRVGPTLGQLEPSDAFRFRPPLVEQRFDEIGRHRDQLETLGTNRVHGSRLQWAGPSQTEVWHGTTVKTYGGDL